jgi:hypothetical protein
MNTPRWDRCIYHQGTHTESFLRGYLAEPHRQVLLIAGAGFDPRSTALPRLMGELSTGRTRGFFIREERPRPDATLVARADENEKSLIKLLSNSSVARLDIFSQDNAVVGGRAAVILINAVSLDGLTDVFVDLSALSIGVGFPIVRHLLDAVAKRGLNLHLVVADEPGTDSEIQSTANDVADTVFGFKGGWGLDSNSRAALLWMPQLAWGKRSVLERIRQRIQPHAFCPILPFPATDPRLPDQLIEHYGEEFENTWLVDARDVVYASERGPLDLYRTILRMDDSRKRVFAEIGGSQIILSPVGSKALAIGALMAALEGEFTIMYVEALGYSADFGKIDAMRARQTTELIHVWLHGEAYAQPGSKEVATK